ncbi:acyl-CoA dehydrogenase family protein [Micromonospora sp. DT228]|uniref:acyl-CoA dehydrogenase family protein n=1 Tax=Micromonospora sp. DT228 TaxID=3393443 RepID=UPI003CFBA19A
MSRGSILAQPVVSVVRDHAAGHDENATFPVEALAAMRTHGLLGMLVPTEYGGLGEDLSTFLEVASELSAHCLSTGQIWAMHCFQVDAVIRYGSADLKATLLPRIAAGEVYIASVTSEGGRKADLLTAVTPLHVDGERVVVERAAPVVTGGRWADGFLITMRASADAPESEVSLVYADRADLHVEPTSQWNSLGVRATESVGMLLKGAVPSHNVIGGPARFPEIARESMVPMSHLGWSACWLGTARGALRELIRWSGKSRDSRHGGSAHSDLFYERIGRVRVALELVSSYLGRARDEVERARMSQQPLSSPRHRLQLNTLKVVASDLTFRAIDDMLQLAGLRTGYLKDSEIPLERHFRDLRSAALNHANDGLLVGIGALTMMDRGVSLI